MFLQIGNSIFSLSQIAHATYCEADPDAPDTDRTLIIQFAGVAKPNFYYGDDADIAWQILCSHCVTSIKSSSRESTAANGFNPNGYVYGYPKTTNRGEDLMS